MTSWARQTGVMSQRRIRGLAAAGLMVAALAGCGTAATAATARTGAGAAQATPEVGCASVNQATTVTVQRHVPAHIPINAGTRTVKQHHPALVRALFRDFCAAVSHPQSGHHYFCPIDFGISYTGTFYDGQRVLAAFGYDTGGCPRVTVIAAGKTKAVLLLGSAAAAAPHLKADLAAVLGVPESQVSGPPGSQSIGPGQQGPVTASGAAA
jgi:hypothetical protein